MLVIPLVFMCGCMNALSSSVSRNPVKQTESQGNDQDELHTTRLDSDLTEGRYSFEFKKGDRIGWRTTCKKMEYHLNGAMISVGDGELRIDGKVLAELKDQDTITFDDSGTVAVNGVVVWPNTAE